MDTRLCFECGDPAQHTHHVVPTVLGGTQVVALCGSCHGKIHGIRFCVPDLTRIGLAKAQARGVLWGAARPDGRRLSPEDAAKGSKAAAVKRTMLKREAYASLRPIVAAWRSEGLALRAIAARLDSEGYKTRTGKSWNPVQVNRVLGYKG